MLNTGQTYQASSIHSNISL